MQVISKILPVLIGCLVGMGVAGCKTTENPDKSSATDAANQVPMKIPVGTVHVVRSDENFVLIKSTRFLQIEPGTDLTVVGTGGVETAYLKVSPARKGQFVTADIVSGLPATGNQVLMDYVAGREAAAPGVGSPGSASEIQVLE